MAEETYNRLSIAHLLLWLTTTAVYFAVLQFHQPIAAVAENLSEKSADANSLESRQWRAERRRRLLAFVFAPVNGVIVASGILFVWRILTRRYGFPTQPGHWLLLILAGLLVLSFIRPVGQAHLPDDLAEAITAGASTFLLILVAVMTRRWFSWTMAFGVFASGFLTMLLAFCLRYLFPPFSGGGLLTLGMLVIGMFPAAVIGCAMTDVWWHRTYDLFHWAGVATLVLMTSHVVIAMLLSGT